VPGDGMVQGTLYAASPMFSGRDLAALDRFEGFDPARPAASWYVREPVRVRSDDGRSPLAHTYRFNRRVPPASLLLPDGDFLEWIARTGQPAFCSAG